MLVTVARRGVVLVVAAALAGGASGPTHAEVYKWTDEHGQIHFSEKKPAAGDVETVRIHHSEPSAEAQEKLRKTLEQDQKARAEREKAAEKIAVEDRNRAVRKKNCEKARTHLDELQRVVRLYHTDNSGNRTRVGETERQADIKAMQEAIKENCGK